MSARLKEVKRVLVSCLLCPYCRFSDSIRSDGRLVTCLHGTPSVQRLVRKCEGFPDDCPLPDVERSGQE